MSGQGNLELYSSSVVSGSSAKPNMRQGSHLRMLSLPFCKALRELSLETCHLPRSEGCISASPTYQVHLTCSSTSQQDTACAKGDAHTTAV